MNKVRQKIQSYIVAGLVIGFAIATFFLTHDRGVGMSYSSVSGLMSLQQMARESVEYETAIASDKPMLIEFYANWCLTCQEIAPTLTQLHQQYGEDVNFVTIDVDDPKQASAIEAYKVTGVPYIAVLDDHRAVVATLTGIVPQSILAGVLEQFDR